MWPAAAIAASEAASTRWTMAAVSTVASEVRAALLPASRIPIVKAAAAAAVAATAAIARRGFTGRMDALRPV